MSHLTIDARAILAYLNELGYRNISAEQLGEFMKDLRKLIKYEERLGTNAHKEDYFQSLFQRTTASFRAKQDKENLKGTKVNETAENKKNNCTIHEKKSAVLEQRRSGGAEQKKSALVQQKSIFQQKPKPLAEQRAKHPPPQDQKKSTQEQKKSTVEQPKSTVEQQKKSTVIQKKSTRLQKSSSVQEFSDIGDYFTVPNVERSRSTVQVQRVHVPPLKLPTSPSSPLASKSTCNFSRTTSNECSSNMNQPQRKILGEAPPALNCPVLKNPYKWFLTGEDDDENENTGKCKTKQRSKINFGDVRRGRKGRSKSPKFSKENCFEPPPHWDGQSTRRSRSQSSGHMAQPSAKALSTPGGNQKKRRSQSSDHPITYRTYTARSMGTMVPQPRSIAFSRGYRACVNDPVKLYHYYQQEWKYFEKQIPGILTRADVRWQIRQKLLDPQ